MTLDGRIKRLEANGPPASRDRRIMELIASAALVKRGEMRGDVARMSEDELLRVIGTDRDSFWRAVNEYARSQRGGSGRY